MPLTYSVIVCAHNEAAYLSSCLHSVLAQTRPPDEVVVVNNASSDATRTVAARVSDIKIVDEPRKGLATSDFHKSKHLYSWKTLVRANKEWPSIKAALRSNVDIAITLFRNGSWVA